MLVWASWGVDGTLIGDEGSERIVKGVMDDAKDFIKCREGIEGSGVRNKVADRKE